MPIYEYTCSECKKRFEIFQKITDKQKKICTECGGKLTKMISQSAFQLKGSGWYKTDYVKKNPTKKTAEVNNTECPKAACKSSDSKTATCSASSE